MEENCAEKILLTKPWRKVGKNPWTKEVYRSLKEEIVTHELLKTAKMEYFNVLLIGQISAGKSSFFNTVESVFSDHVTMKANAGAVDKSLTTQYRTYKVRANDHKNKPIKFRFGDTMGLEGGNSGLMAADVAKIMDGHVNDMAELSSGGIRPGDSGYNPSPTVGDQIHCVAYVVDSSKLAYLDDNITDKLKEIREEANHRCLNPIIILTRVDQVCDETAEDITKVYNSPSIKEKVQEVSRKFGITENMIYPVQNYSSETEKELGIDILNLRTLRQILRCSQDFLQDRVDRDKEMLKQAARTTREIQKRHGGKLKREDTIGDSDDSADNSCVEEYSTCPSEDEDEKSDDESEVNRESESKQKKGARSSIRSPPLPPFQALNRGDSRAGVSLHDFKPRNPEQIRLKRGDKVHELNPDLGGWTKVHVKHGKQGLVPTSFIEWKAKEEKAAPPPPYTPRKSKCLYVFTSTTAEEVDIAEDEEVEPIDNTENGWTKIRKSDNSEGLVPTNYLETVTHVTPTVKTPPPPPIKKTCTASYGYLATSHDQVDMMIGEQFILVEEKLEGGWTLVQNNTGQKGKVPNSYLKIDHAPDLSNNQAPSPPQIQAPPPPPSASNIQAPLPPPTISCSALYAFKATNPQQQDMFVGEQFSVLEENIEGGWTLVKNYTGEKGNVPTSYLKKDQAPVPPGNVTNIQAATLQAPPAPPSATNLEAPPPPPSATTIQAPQPPPPPTLSCSALYNYKAMNPDQLDMVVGDLFSVMEENIGGGWTLVKNNNGKTGNVPTSYLEIGQARWAEQIAQIQPQVLFQTNCMAPTFQPPYPSSNMYSPFLPPSTTNLQATPPAQGWFSPPIQSPYPPQTNIYVPSPPPFSTSLPAQAPPLTISATYPQATPPHGNFQKGDIFAQLHAPNLPQASSDTSSTSASLTPNHHQAPHPPAHYLQINTRVQPPPPTPSNPQAPPALSPQGNIHASPPPPAPGNLQRQPPPALSSPGNIQAPPPPPTPNKHQAPSPPAPPQDNMHAPPPPQTRSSNCGPPSPENYPHPSSISTTLPTSLPTNAPATPTSSASNAAESFHADLAGQLKRGKESLKKSKKQGTKEQRKSLEAFMSEAIEVRRSEIDPDENDSKDDDEDKWN